MEYIVGISLALLFCSAAAWLGMDRERVFYPAVVMAVAPLIVLLASAIAWFAPARRAAAVDPVGLFKSQ